MITKLEKKIMRRLHQALEHLGHNSEEQKAAFLAAVTGKQIRTVMSWLKYKSFARDWRRLIRAFVESGFDAGWIWGEHRPMSRDDGKLLDWYVKFCR